MHLSLWSSVSRDQEVVIVSEWEKPLLLIGSAAGGDGGLVEKRTGHNLKIYIS